MKIKGYCVTVVDYDYDYYNNYYFDTLYQAWTFYKNTNVFTYDIVSLRKIDNNDIMYSMVSKQNSYKLI